jgi:AraC-like DNA-binding protein
MNDSSYGKTELTITSGYHHYLDTGICSHRRDDKYFIIDGAVVRLIRFGSSFTTTTRTKLYNVTITVNNGELWYLNTSHEIDEFCGALTIIFNNGTYSKFLADYSAEKIVPQKGKYFIISPKCRGMKLIASNTVGSFIVSGNLIAYSIAEDGKSARYSIYSSISLPEGISKIKYVKKFSTALLDSPPKNMKWHDNGMGIVSLIPDDKKETVYVCAYAECYDKADGTDSYPFQDIKTAVSFFGDKDGTVIIKGKVPFTTYPAHIGTITFQGEDSSSCLIFDKNIHYYLQGNTVFKNLRLLMQPGGNDKTMIVANGHNLLYGDGIVSDIGVLSCTGLLENFSDIIRIKRAFFVPKHFFSRNIDFPLYSNCFMFLCSKGKCKILYENKSKNLLLNADSAAVISNNTVCSFEYDGVEADFKLLAVEFTHLGADDNIKPKVIETLNSAFFADVIFSVFNMPSLLIDKNWLASLSVAIEQMTQMNISKKDIAQRLSDYISQNFSSTTSVSQLSDVFHLDRSYLERAYKKAYGISLKNELTQKKCREAMVLLKKGFSVGEVSKMVGYDSASSFSRAFKKETGMSPKNASYLINH